METKPIDYSSIPAAILAQVEARPLDQKGWGGKPPKILECSTPIAERCHSVYFRCACVGAASAEKRAIGKPDSGGGDSSFESSGGKGGPSWAIS